MQPDDPRHGTNAGYQAHHKWGVPVCEDCRTAHAQQHQGFRNRKYLERLDSLLIDPGPTVRRVRALQAIGWTLADIDLQLGKTGTNAVWNMLHQPTIHVDTAAKMSSIYNRLHMTPGPSKRTRDIAVKKGWLPPLAYDDIDLGTVVPYAVKINNSDSVLDEIDPVLVQRVLDGDMSVCKDATPAEREEIVSRWLTESRSSLADLERRSGWNVARYVKRVRAKEAA